MSSTTALEAADPVLAASLQEPRWPETLQARAEKTPQFPDGDAEPYFVLPQRLLEAIHRRVPGLISEDDLRQETEWSQEGRRQNILGWWQNRAVRHFLLSRAGPAHIPEHFVAQLGWQTLLQGKSLSGILAESTALSQPVVEQLQAYLGWLICNPVFLDERDLVRTQVSEALATIGGLSHVKEYLIRLQVGDVGPQIMPPSVETLAAISQYTSFLKRWQLVGFVGWDLPLPIGANLGGPAVTGKLIGVDESPALQLPPTIRLPDRYPVLKILRAPLTDPLDEWKLVLEECHPSGFNFARWGRLLELRFYRDIVLGRRYRERLKRTHERLDWAFADYFGDASNESVRKLRLWLQSRLRTATERSATDR